MTMTNDTAADALWERISKDERAARGLPVTEEELARWRAGEVAKLRKAALRAPAKADAPIEDQALMAARQFVRVGEQHDFDRLMRWAGKWFLRVVDPLGAVAYIGTKHGLWAKIDRRMDMGAVGRLRQLLEYARAEDAQYATRLAEDARLLALKPLLAGAGNAAKLKVLAEGIAQRIVSYDDAADGVATISYSDFNNRTRNPVVPLVAGGAWDVRAGAVIDANTLLPMHMLDAGWAVPTPQEGDGEAKTPAARRMAALFDEGGPLADIIWRCAAYVSGTYKTVDAVSGKAGVGKTGAIEAMARALPGAFAIIQGPTALHASTSRFTPVEEHLRRCLAVFIDEADKAKPGTNGIQVTAGMLNPWTANKLTVELKGVQPFTARRMGTVCLVGNQWPKVDPTAGGMRERLQWAFDLGDQPIIEDADYKALEDPEAQAWLRWHLLAYARQFMAGGEPWLVTPSRAADADAVLDASMPELAHELRALYEADERGFVANATIKADFGDELPAKSELAWLMRCAFGAVRNGLKRVDGKPSRGWFGISAKP